MENKSVKRVLICPLDWGLGHATRCIPIIQEFIDRGCEVFIASSGQALSLLKREFTLLTFDELPSYNPQYSVLLPMSISMALQIPSLLKVIEQEQKVLKEIVTKRKIDLVISDNRYGCWSKNANSIFITHQINIIVPWYAKKIVNNFSNKCIERFSFCWIPDWKGFDSIAGNLSKSGSKKARYIGPLSRFKKLTKQERQYDIIAIVSGPEPQRSEFEKLLRRELIKWGSHQETLNVSDTSLRNCLLVKGVPSDSSIKKGDVDEVDFLNAEDLNKMIVASDVVICRSGYSTIMDLAKIGRKAILVPTPGQTEQEYLAESLMKKGIMYSEKQSSFNLERSLMKTREYKNDFTFSSDGLELKKAIDEVLC